jgi:phytoene dehydrogenase-like protein
MNVGIVGGGLGGLVSAVLLARRGVDVTVFERSGSLGGRARTDELEGAKWNSGPRALYRGGHAERVLRASGFTLAGAPPKTRGFALARSELHTLPVSLLSLLVTGLFDAKSKWEAMGLLARLGKLRAEGDESLGKFLERTVRSPDVRALLELFVRLATYTHPVESLRAKDALSQLALATGPGVLYLDGGWQKLVDQAVVALEAAGGKRVCDAPVSRVLVDERHDERRVTGLELDGREARFDAVVLAVDPKAAAKLVPEDTAIFRVAADVCKVHAACLDLRLEGVVHDTTVLFGVDEPVYVSMHSAAAKLAPEGVSVVHAMRYLAPGDTCEEAELSSLVARLYPEARVTHSRYLPKMVVMHARPDATSGGLEGRIASPETRGLELVGDWVGARGMLLDAVLASAEDAAERIVTRGSSRPVRRSTELSTGVS